MPTPKTTVTVHHNRRVYAVRRDRVLREVKMSGTRAAPHVVAILRKRGVHVEEVGMPHSNNPAAVAREQAIQRLLYGKTDQLAEAS